MKNTEKNYNFDDKESVLEFGNAHKASLSDKKFDEYNKIKGVETGMDGEFSSDEAIADELEMVAFASDADVEIEEFNDTFVEPPDYTMIPDPTKTNDDNIVTANRS